MKQGLSRSSNPTLSNIIATKHMWQVLKKLNKNKNSFTL